MMTTMRRVRNATSWKRAPASIQGTMPTIWGTTLSEHRALVRERLLDAFSDLVRERGLEATTLAAVAERAGIARSAVYNHVKDKHDLLLGHTARVLEDTADELRRALDAETGPERKLRRYVEVAFTSWAAEPGAGSDLMPTLSEEEQARLRAQLAPMLRILGGLVQEGVAEGRFGAGEPSALTRFVAATLEGYRRALGSGELEPGETAEQVAGLLLHGLRGDVPQR
jgi:AcrR family transcriptional regulator